MRRGHHRHCVLPRTVEEIDIQQEDRSESSQQQEVGHFQAIGAVHPDAALREDRPEKEGVVVEAGEKHTVHHTTP